jgi:hypothetical protein
MRYASMFATCTAFGSSPELVDGFHAYAPELSHSGGGFKSSYFSKLARLENDNFWFRSRNQLILWALKSTVQILNRYLKLAAVLDMSYRAYRNIFPSPSYMEVKFSR